MFFMQLLLLHNTTPSVWGIYGYDIAHFIYFYQLLLDNSTIRSIYVDYFCFESYVKDDSNPILHTSSSTAENLKTISKLVCTISSPFYCCTHATFTTLLFSTFTISLPPCIIDPTFQLAILIFFFL